MTRLLPGLAAAALSFPAVSAAHEAPPAAAASSARAPEGALERALAEWRARHGAAWRAHLDASTGRLEFLFGGSAAPSRAPAADEDFEDLAREAVAATHALHGIASEELVLDAVRFLPLAQIGSTDKLAVRFVQRVGGLPVEAGTLSCVFDTRGRLVALQAQGVPEARRIELQPSLPPERARALAAAAFGRDEGELASSVSGATLTITRARGGALAWRVEVRSELEGAMPVGRAYWIDAHDGDVLDSHATVHQLEVRGTVRALVSPGLQPDTAANPEVATPMRHVRVSSSAGTVTTDAAGQFSFPGVNNSLQVTVGFAGPFNNVQNVAGAEYTLTATLPANQDNVLTMNPSSAAQVTAQGNAFHHVNLLRDWIRSIVPTDATADFVMNANVNLSQTCNAYFDGGSTNYFLSGGGCVNTAYSTVVAHENGHWLNVRYGTGNGMDGMGEGNADVFAMYLYDTPVVGQGFCGTNCHIRTGLNTRQFCGDLSPSCYGQVHADGEVWMGAAWKIRARLGAHLGDAAGDLAANTLFLSWMNAFDQGAIRSVIESQWLALDDDDGNLNNGSPHYLQIDGGFREQGFPGFELRPVTIETVTLVPDAPADVGPYGVDAAIAVHFPGATLAGASLHWRVNGAPFVETPLVPQGGTWCAAAIPPVAAPAQVDYYLTASDSLGNALRWPSPMGFHGFRVGSAVPFASFDFESGPAGWTHASYGDTANSGDEWQLGAPGGRFGDEGMPGGVVSWRDPAAAWSGTNCWGYDLGNGSNGKYGTNIHVWLRSPAIDCTEARGTRLSFRRWLSVQYGVADQARVRVNGQVVWSNPASQHLLEQAWSLQELDISALADGQPAVQVEFELQSDGSVQLGGWNVDDVVLSRLGPAAGGCLAPTTYGPGKLHSGGTVAVLEALGEPSALFGPFQLRLDSAVPLRPAMVYSSHAPASTPLLGGTLLIAQPFAREVAWTTDALGDASATYTVQPFQVGTTRFFQCVFRDPASPDGTGLGFSRALRVSFCP
ncbi:MAG: PepSY domain-containing protein [Planctomycetes bacterium]|nr:PepSY domain-containing protein [Planctomycetota bacterium]